MTHTASDTLPKFKSDESKKRYLAAYETVLAAWPVAFEERDVPTPLGMTHVIASGPPDAPPLVLLHSLAATATSWRLNVEGLSRHFRVYAVDIIGQPGKSAAIRSLKTREDYGVWFTALLDGLGIARASIIGCSFGGFLAANQAQLTPERVEKVVLISPVGTFASQYWKLLYAMGVRAPLARLWRRITGAKAASGMTDYARRLPRDMIWAGLMGVTLAEGAELSVISPAVFSRRQLRSMRTPTLLLIGDAETLFDPAATVKMAEGRMPNLTGAVVPDADHIAAMAQPDDVNARIIGFLRG